MTRDGRAQTGELVDLSARGFTLRIDGRSLEIPREDVAAVEFEEGGRFSQSAVDTAHAIVVLRNGGVVEGHLSDIGGTRPLRLTLDTGRGYRDFTSDDVARIYFYDLNGRFGGGAFTDARPAAAYGDAGPASRQVTVSADQPWTATGLRVNRGDRLSFDARGQIAVGNNKSAGPGGNPGATAPGVQYPAFNAPVGALIGRIDNGTPFVIGTAGYAMPMPESGELFLGINDDHFPDNGGSFVVTVEER